MSNATATNETVAAADIDIEGRILVLATKQITAQKDCTAANKMKLTADAVKKEVSTELFGTYRKEGVKDPVIVPGLIATGDTVTLGEVTYLATQKDTTGVAYKELLQHVATRLWQGNPPKWFTDAEAAFVNKGLTFALVEQK